MGSAAAWRLARRGARTAVFERFHVGHRRGSSHGRSRIFRLSYHDARYVRMAQDALRLWREAEGESGRPLVRTTGGLDTGKALDDHAAALEECGVPFEVLDGETASSRFPALALPPRAPVLFQPNSGVVAADAAWETFVGLARGRGARVAEDEPAVALERNGDAVAVRTDRGRYRASAVVVAAGAWSRGLLATVGVELPTVVTRETVAYFRVEPPAEIPTLLDWGTPAVYALPSPGQGIKAGEHQAGPEADPDDPGAPDPGSVERLSGWVAERYPAADPRPHHAETCLYTNAPNDELIVERHGRIVVASPCSGHGFKFAPVIGERIADLALG